MESAKVFPLNRNPVESSAAGSGFFRQPAITPTDRQEKNAGITFMNRFCNGRLKKVG